MKEIFALIAVIALFSCTRIQEQRNPVLDILGGKVQGVLCDSLQVISYKGIPYAAPPIGELRWKKPYMVIPWDTVMIANMYAPAAIQRDHHPDYFYSREFYREEDPVRSEDCLYLNIWTPASAAGKPNKNLPVAMWIHGGAYMGGWGHEVAMDGKAWAKQDVILVTINYRLGLLGFLVHPLLSDENTEGLSGNYGVYDQIAALKWIKQNISAFGGDPDNITVFGQSAGAASVKNLISSSLSKEDISKAIIQSGGDDHFIGSSDYNEAEKTGIAIMDIFGYHTLKQMRTATSAELDSLVTQYTNTKEKLIFGPVIDGHLLTENFREAILNNRIADVPYMIGYTSDDLNDMDSVIEKFCLTRDSLSSHPSYAYLFSHRLPGDNSGASHSSELSYVFNTLSNSWRPFTNVDYTLSNEMVNYWTNFVKWGNPNGKGSETWHPYTRELPYIMILQTK